MSHVETLVGGRERKLLGNGRCQDTASKHLRYLSIQQIVEDLAAAGMGVSLFVPRLLAWPNTQTIQGLQRARRRTPYQVGSLVDVFVLVHRDIPGEHQIEDSSEPTTLTKHRSLSDEAPCHCCCLALRMTLMYF